MHLTEAIQPRRSQNAQTRNPAGKVKGPRIRQIRVLEAEGNR
jgi:hypothetical protein